MCAILFTKNLHLQVDCQVLQYFLNFLGCMSDVSILNTLFAFYSVSIHISYILP